MRTIACGGAALAAAAILAEAPSSASVDPTADLASSLVAAPALVTTGETATFTFSVVNRGPDVAEEVEVVAVASRLEFTEASFRTDVGDADIRCAIPPRVVEAGCFISRLPTAKTFTLTLRGRARLAGPLAVTVTVSSPARDPQLADNAATARLHARRPRNRAPRIASHRVLLLDRGRSSDVEALVRVCDDYPGSIRAVVTQEHRGRTGRAVTRSRHRLGRLTSACGSYRLRWRVSPRFARQGRYALVIRVRDSGAALSRPLRRSWRIRA